MFQQILLRIALIIAVAVSRMLVALVQLTGKGSGTALPGLLVELYMPWIIKPISSQLKHVIFISGTNGKTTTRALLVDTLEQQKISVISNRGGANIFRGIASALLLNTNWFGNVRSTFAILEVEEATMPRLARYLKPDILVLTNIFRDQLDAYGEVDKTLEYFRQTITETQPRVIANTDDAKLVAGIISSVKDVERQWYGFGLEQEKKFRPDFEDEATTKKLDNSEEKTDNNHITLLDSIEPKNGMYHFKVNTESASYNGSTLLPGRYNLYNVAAAIAVLSILNNTDNSNDDAKPRSLSTDLEHIARFQPVFGRGERVQFGSQPVTLLLVKNPAGFNQVLSYLAEMYQGYPFHVDLFINDNIADGKDVSWLWDIDFESFQQKVSNKKVPGLLQISQLHTGGSRGFDMALRLQYAGFDISEKDVFGSIKNAIDDIKKRSQPTIILCTYTALLELRKELATHVSLPDIGEAGN